MWIVLIVIGGAVLLTRRKAPTGTGGAPTSGGERFDPFGVFDLFGRYTSAPLGTPTQPPSERPQLGPDDPAPWGYKF